jgi:hypothetical protein
MPRRLLDLRAVPLLDIASYARRGLSRRDRFAPGELEIIARTVHRTPEVMVKVLTRGSQTLGGVRRHFDYLSRKGELAIETDDGQELKGKGLEKRLLLEWDLDLDEARPTFNLGPRPGRTPPKLVHKVLFSMPAGTPPKKVLAAVRNFAREEFALKHRYAMVLHTDEPHPHVHMVVKAMSEDGVRLNIRKATLRHWRREFARQLRAQGVAANATERAVRGENTPRKLDGIYRAVQRGASTHYRKRAEVVARELANRGLAVEPGKARLLETRQNVVKGWSEVADQLVIEGNLELARAVQRFVREMPKPLTEKELLGERLTELRERSKSRAERERQR